MTKGPVSWLRSVATVRPRWPLAWGGKETNATMWELMVSGETAFVVDTTPWQKQLLLQRKYIERWKKWHSESQICLNKNCCLCTYAVNADDLLTFFSALNLPVEFGVFNQHVGVSIPNEHFTAHTSKTFRVVLLLSSNLFVKGGSVMKDNAEAEGIWHFGVVWL